ncbi:unnamed protein product [Clonostachys rosea]|uniref:Aminotransferase class I/classII large domain-containing protein n=1 Tax=Bionectria ochroleuca TaxID=29856 RepID=A0ABY6V331_BIOOC|nr:unnamed protein product [Clonostachys rosea]
MIAKISETLEHINLQGGWPTPRLHPTKEIDAASSALFKQKDIQQNLRYGPELGSSNLRGAIADWLTESYAPKAGPVVSERVAITNGASNGLACALQKFSDPSYTQGVWMVEPTYFLACPIFRDAGLGGKIFGVPEGDDGIDLEYLGNRLQEVDERTDPLAEPRKTVQGGYPKIYRHIVYIIPTFSNPSGGTMSLESRKRLIKLARKHDALVVSDDVYDVLRWPASENEALEAVGAFTPRLVDVDRNLEGFSAWGNTLSNGSFSKIVAPGIRVGWVEAMPALISAMGTVGATVSGGCQAHFASIVVEKMLSSGALSSHIQKTLIPTYRARWLSMTKAIREHLYPLGVRIVGDEGEKAGKIAGGFFLYLSFNACAASGPTIASIALDEYNLKIAPGGIFSVPDDPESKVRGEDTYLHGARLCWAWNEEVVLVDGIKRLAKAILDASK